VAWTFDNILTVYYVFPRFEADPDQPDSYDFFQSDWYLKSIESLGIEMIYCLGPTAEYPKLPPRHFDPPKDFEKWAKVCVNMIKHYNGGWANGHHYNIKYWEIWNEPNAGFWAGPKEQYSRLYEITAKAIKAYDPTLKVGGPALSPGGLPFLEKFLEYCQNHKVPLDFLSWHMYTAQTSDIIPGAAKIRELLDKYGYPNAESVLDEWSYFRDEWWEPLGAQWNGVSDPRLMNSVAQEVQGVAGAAFDASVLMLLQDTTVNIANFYHGATIVMWGLFNEHGVPKKTYYTFEAFKSLLDTPERVVTGGSDQSSLTAIAGLSHDKTQATLLISNYGTQFGHYNIRLNSLPWKDGVVYEKYILDRSHDLDLVKTETLVGTSAILPEDVEVPSVCMIRLKANTNK
jgi:hypothetical protein